MDAFLSTIDRPPCGPSVTPLAATAARTGAKGGVSEGRERTSSGGGATNNVRAAEGAEAAARAAGRAGSARPSEPSVSCRCYEGAAGPFPGRRHDPWEGLEALRPPGRRRPPPTPPRPSSRTGGSTEGGLKGRGGENGDQGSEAEGGDAGRDGGSSSGGGAGGGSDVEGGGRSTAVDPLGAVLLLCEVLRRSEGRWTSTSTPASPSILRRRERCCCAWVLDHLAALFPGWVEAASVADAAPGTAASADHAGVAGRELASALCNEVAIALGLFVCRRALSGEFQEAQVRRGGACSHVHGKPYVVCM